jgi:acetyltransferase-like isoleucine patch superfamily enzyme
VLKKIYLPRFLINFIFQMVPPSRFFNQKKRLFEFAGILVDEDVKINSEIKIYGEGSISLGKNTWLGIGAEFFVPTSSSVVIGANCDIAPRVTLLCGTHVLGDGRRRAGNGLIGDIYVGNGVWIGVGSILLPNVYLEDGIVVAAGSVVIKGHYPANSLLAGNPARIKKYYE